MTGVTAKHSGFVIILSILSLFMLPNLGTGKAKETFEKALEQQPDDVDTRLRYAVFLSRQGELDEAERHANQVIKDAPEYWDAHLLLARVAGWQHEFERALAHVNTVLEHEPDYPGAIRLKLDILKWMQDYTATELLLRHLIATGANSADIYFRLAEVERAKLRYLLAYRHAVSALRLDPRHDGAKAIRDDTRRVTFQMSQELEYFGFDKEEAGPDRWGMGTTISATAFQNARFSAALAETVRYRFRTINNQIGLQTDFRPLPHIGFTVMGQLGKPARVVPPGTFLFAVRGEMFKVMDASLSLILNILSWPQADKAVLLRPSLSMGFFIHKQFRLGATYSAGILRYCELDPVVTHSGFATGSYHGPKITASITAGYSEERDPVTVGIIPPKTCKEIVALRRIAVLGNERFILVDVRTVHTGVNLSYKFNRTASLRGGYRLELKKADTHNDTIPAHITHLGISVWF